MPDACQAEDLSLVVTMNGPADHLLDLRERDGSRELRLAHRAATFFLAFEAAEPTLLVFLAATDVCFIDVALAEAGFLAADFVDSGLAEDFDPDLAGAFDGLADTDLAVF